MPTAEAEALPAWLSEISEGELVEEGAFDWMPTELVAEEAEQEPVEVTVLPVLEPLAKLTPEPVLPVPSSAPVLAQVRIVEPEVSAPTPAAVPQGAQFDQYRQRLETNPNDHAIRLELARVLRGQQQTISGLDQYETLINASQQLQEVVNDLKSLVSEKADMPRARRLLGDAYMRQGRLQEALEAYRSALNKL
jgi:predicted Zn-dependent protease